MKMVRKIYYFLYRQVYEITYIPKRIKWFIQRGSRGWADNDCWNMGGYLDAIIPQMIKRLKQGYIGYPSDLTPEKWDDILSRIEKGFSDYNEWDNCVPEVEYLPVKGQWLGRLSPEDQIKIDEWNAGLYDRHKRIIAARKLLVKYWDSLWD